MAQAPSQGACCDACATLPVVDLAPRLRPALDRDGDRRIAFVGLIMAVGFVAAAVVTAVTGVAGHGTVWLPLHLALAGGAGTAIAAVLPFFTTALAVAPPGGRRVRMAAIGLVAGGAVAITAAVTGGDPFLGHIGGSAYILGIAAIGVAAFRPLRGALGTRRRMVERAYGLALVMVGVSATLATAFLSGWLPVVERWAVLKPAHAWLNLFGFVSLVIVATLVHLAPTLEGGRIRPRRSARTAITGLAVGVPLIALGTALDASLLGRVGAALVLVGALAVTVHAAVVARDRGQWTTDPGWHRLTRWSVRAGAGWFAVATLVAAGRVLWLGPVPAAWSVQLIAVPFALGWAIQVLIGAWSHLLPAIGPGGTVVHARQRAWLGWQAAPRLVAWQAAVAALWVGTVMGVAWLTAVGAATITIALVLDIGLTVAAAAATDTQSRQRLPDLLRSGPWWRSPRS